MIFNGELVFKAYNNNAPTPMRKCELSKLSVFTQFARMEAWGSKLNYRYNNVFAQSNYKGERWVYYIDEQGGYHGGADKKGLIVTKEYKYQVFDDINNIKRYDIPRVENMNDNSQIRFRIVGGRNQGLFV